MVVCEPSARDLRGGRRYLAGCNAVALGSIGWLLAGRLRSKWIGPRPDEVLFRDTAHGFLAWALATVIVAALFTLGTLGAGAAVATGEAAPTAQAATALSAEARDAAANFSIITAISLLVGGFIGAAAGGLGGYHRDAM